MNFEPPRDFASFTSDELRELYRKDPVLFNELAADAIRRACIGKTPAQTLKLRQMQWTIDAHLRKGKTPLERMHIMENIFYDKVYGSGGLLSKLVSSWSELDGRAVGRPMGHCKSSLRLVKK